MNTITTIRDARALEYAERPEVLKRPEVKGVFVGACVEGHRFRRLAHAHTHKTDPNHGWICVLGEKRLSDRLLMLHELAHILTNKGHDDEWRATLLKLGGSLCNFKDHRRFDKRGRAVPNEEYMKAYRGKADAIAS